MTVSADYKRSKESNIIINTLKDIKLSDITSIF